LTLIAGDVAAGLDAAHSNAAFFADRIQARTRLIYGTGDDGAKRGALKWEMRNSQADIQPYEGGHDFYKDGQFTKISQMVVDWLLEEPAIKRLARRKMHETVRRKQKKKVKA
jgi:hypothetical protein